MIDKNLLQQFNLFGELKSFEWEELLKIIKEKEFVEGDIIFGEDATSTELYLLLKGRVAIQIKIAPQLADSTVYIVEPHDIFGEFAFIDPQPRSATARCAEDSTLGIIQKNDFQELVAKFPEIGLNFYRTLVRLLTDRLRKMNKNLKATFLRSSGIKI